MSLEAALAENTSAMTALAEVMKTVVANQERLLAGQQIAIEKIDAGRGAGAEPKTTRRRSTKDDKAAEQPVGDEGNGKSGSVATESAAADVASASDGPSSDDLLKTATAYLNKFNPKTAGDKADATKYQERGKFLMSMLKDEFGVGKIPEIEEASDRKRALFYLKRHAAGHPVDFKADYDFDGAPDQDVAAAAVEADEFDIG